MADYIYLKFWCASQFYLSYNDDGDGDLSQDDYDTVEVYRSSSGGDLFMFNYLPLFCEDFIYFMSFIFKLSIKKLLANPDNTRLKMCIMTEEGMPRPWQNTDSIRQSIHHRSGHIIKDLLVVRNNFKENRSCITYDSA